ncbi:alpha-L-iduronidase-like isoform X2 [Acanthaster planci]|uniref:Alpha-L-iduronidase-like isoform X2 n=1 Tax=Acanthaster planci TaxID=133434 RepID=A0A8B7YTD8_ACAPL|nr:alpha-L-iduronidase-like isoform X2 [Acanthaster planci]
MLWPSLDGSNLANPPLPHQKSFEYFLSESELQNLILIGSVPHGGIQQVRIHWLLDLITLSVNSLTGQISLNFDLLDQLVDRLWSNGLRPGFELMGNPSNWFTDFEDTDQVYVWRDMVTALAKRYIDKYGLDYVAKWNFESWNEPDHKDFDNLNFTVQGFLNYYDACSEGLRVASPKLRLGGPAGACREPSFSVICWALLQHCENGTNYFTGETGVRIDFISFHHKGKGHSMYILDTEIQTIQRIQRLYPCLASVPIFNDEADPLVGWSKPEEWRADATYAAVVVKVIAHHQNLLIRQRPDVNYALLSNDNGFLDFNPHFFTQRTLVARFQMNETHPPSIQTVRKPVLSVMGLLALLGETQVQVVSDTGKGGNNSDVGILASVHHASAASGSHDSWQGSIIIYNSNDTSNLTGTDNITLTVTGVPTTNQLSMVYIVYLVDNTHGNPYRPWKAFGKPVYPTRKQFVEIRKHQDPLRIKGPNLFTAPKMTFNFNLSKPGVMLFHLCAKPSEKPPQVKSVKLHSVTQTDVLVSWEDVSSCCLLTYQVEFSPTKQGQYVQISDVDLIFTSYLYSIESANPSLRYSSTQGWYRVRAVDYWNRSGMYSTPIELK